MEYLLTSIPATDSISLHQILAYIQQLTTCAATEWSVVPSCQDAVGNVRAICCCMKYSLHSSTESNWWCNYCYIAAGQASSVELDKLPQAILYHFHCNAHHCRFFSVIYSWVVFKWGIPGTDNVCTKVVWYLWLKNYSGNFLKEPNFNSQLSHWLTWAAKHYCLIWQDCTCSNWLLRWNITLQTENALVTNLLV